jgi:Flp pilus assembly protein TadD
LPFGLLALLLIAPESLPGCPPEASEAAREEARLLFEAGQAELAAGRGSEGEEALRDAIRLDPASPFPHYALGLAFMERQRFAEAIQAFSGCREALRCLREGDPEARARFLDRVDRQIQEIATTVAGLERERLQKSAIAWQEMNGDPKPPLGQSAQVVHALEQRLAELRRLRTRPEREPAAVALALGNAHFHAGALEDAEREFRTALLTEPHNGDAHNNLAVVLMLQGELDEAEREVKAAEKTGLKVAPRLKEEIKKRRATASPVNPLKPR